MAKKQDTPIAVPMDGYIIYPYQIQQLEGKLLTFIESLGLKESQEKSAKDMFKDIYYGIAYMQTEFMPGKYLGIAREEYHKDGLHIPQNGSRAGIRAAI